MGKINHTKATFALGFNFSDSLVEGIININNYNQRKVSEVFGAFLDSPLSSARPSAKLPIINWHDFKRQAQLLSANNIRFNYLFNTQQPLHKEIYPQFDAFLEKLLNIGVCHLTVGNIEVAKYVRNKYPQYHQTLSLTYGIKSFSQLQRIEKGLFDAVYLDGASVNRDFKRIREFVQHKRCEIKLYANISCVSNCPVIRQHYSLFSAPQTEKTIIENDNYFKGCSLVKLSNAIEYIQMPWIRPEDIKAYVEEGITHFKLTDRLSTTETLLKIAKAYLSEKSTANLFELIERNGDKYKYFHFTGNIKDIIRIDSNKIPVDFINHYRFGTCTSANSNCIYCQAVAKAAITISGIDTDELIQNYSNEINSKLFKRIKPK